MTRHPPQPHDDDLACQAVVEIVGDYLEGALAPAERRRLEAHLESCPYCTEYVEQMRTIGRSLRGLDRDTIAPERRDALVAAFRGWREP